MKFNRFTPLLTAVFAAISSVTSQAAITVTGSDTLHLASVGTGTGISYTIQNTDSVLLVGMYLDSASPIPATVTFGGVAATGFISTDRTTLAYWQNLATGAGTVQLTGGFGSGDDVIYGLYELAGVDLGAGVTSSITGTITTPTDGELVVNFTGQNTNNEPTPSGTSIIDSNPIGANTAGGAGGALSGGTGLAGLAGSQDISWTYPAPPAASPQGIVSYSFVAIPEPSAALLGGLGALFLLRRRR